MFRFRHWPALGGLTTVLWLSSAQAMPLDGAERGANPLTPPSSVSADTTTTPAASEFDDGGADHPGAPMPAGAAAPSAGQPARPPAQASLSPPRTVDVTRASVELNDPTLFPRPPILQPAIAFWTDVFQKYSEYQSVIHAYDAPDRVYAVLDFTQRVNQVGPIELARERDAAERQALAHVDEVLTQIDAAHGQRSALNAEQQRIYDLFGDDHDPLRFRHAIGNSRVQHGLRERTAHALEVSERYLPEMERIFAGYGLPTVLTRLPLVESSFNLEAYSKVGAAGLWQFIPAAARTYMRLNNVADDRRDPWFSTDAAARHLKDDFDSLGSWPLALTAYNFGRGGVSRGLQKIDGSTLTDLLERYQDDRFGFASRNFYAEFVAAADTEAAWRAAHAGEDHSLELVRFDTVHTRDFLSWDTLQHLSGASTEQFRQLNPSYKPEVLTGRLYVPAGDLIRVPPGDGPRFEAAYAALAADERHEQQRPYYVSYRFARGDNLGRVARRYRVSVADILDANGLDKNARLRVGQMLNIPPHTVDAVLTTTRPSHGARAAERVVNYKLHHVRKGQTLGSIARQYRTTVDALRSLNSLHGLDALHEGATLKVPR